MLITSIIIDEYDLVDNKIYFQVRALDDIHYIFVSGRQIKEPIAWGGPIVMNTQEELELAFQELDKGTFIKGSKG